MWKGELREEPTVMAMSLPAFDGERRLIFHRLTEQRHHGFLFCFMCHGIILMRLIKVKKRVYNGYSDPCDPVHITIGDGGNREGLPSKYVLWKVLYVIKLFTSSSFY
ncbi:hypothetical protein CFOL_v3_19672 [Cephalotus follicularis]|uniref:Uncharacterized protein n=1 Tax=Cephalotus follicularis TaxID=3775 RepID=A0A1Q3C7E6_CEPFO|nr:hypothetical protein CFOL_v3_19672 [Cephalotus follicularis]